MRTEQIHVTTKKGLSVSAVPEILAGHVYATALSVKALLRLDLFDAELVTVLVDVAGRLDAQLRQLCTGRWHRRLEPETQSCLLAALEEATTLLAQPTTWVGCRQMADWAGYAAQVSLMRTRLSVS